MDTQTSGNDRSMQGTPGMTYAGTGVNYNTMDPFKKKAQVAAAKTAGNILRILGGSFKEFTPSRGESAFLIEAPDHFIAHVEEGLGTKNLIADTMFRLTGKHYYRNIAQCTIAMIVNDLITLGALPFSVAMHLAVGTSDWFDDEERSTDLINGWLEGCNLARCIWGGGETPTLKGIIVPDASLLSGSAVGIVKPKERLITDRIEDGDYMVFIESSGVHANGLTLCRKIGERKDKWWKKLLHRLMPEKFPLTALPNGYLTRLPDGRTYGETLLDPTHIYVGVVEDCLNAGVDIHYAVNVTGHGWRKLMRAVRNFTYTVTKLPTQQPIFDFIQEHGPVDEKEMYGNFNKGLGFALYTPKSHSAKVIEIAEKLGFKAFVGGHIKAGEKKVVIEPNGLVYEGKELDVR